MDSKTISKDDIKKGFLFTHQMMSENQHSNLTSLSYSMAVVELLVSKGIIGINEFDDRKKLVEQRMQQDFEENYTKVVIGENHNKYAAADKEVRINCEERVHLCKARCCSYYFFLSKQDVEEGLIKWDLSRPYCIEQNEDGYCMHLDRKTLKCSVREQRPLPCRGYNCKDDKKIWDDFEKMVPTEEQRAFTEHQERKT